MRALFWLGLGCALGAVGYRYYLDNGGRLPILEELLGGDTSTIATKARETAETLRDKGQQVIREEVSDVSRQAVVATAEEIADAERAKAREKSRRRP